MARLISLTWNSFLVLALSAILFFGIYALFLTLRKESMVREIEELVLQKLRQKNNT